MIKDSFFKPNKLLKKKLDADKKKSRAFIIFDKTLKRPATKENYIGCLDQIMQFLKLDKYAKLVDMEKNARQDKLEEFMISREHLSHSGCQGFIKALVKFLEMNRCIYWRAPLTSLLPGNRKAKKAGGTPYTTEEIRTMLDVAKTVRAIALIQFFVCTGARPGAISDPDGYLRIGDLQPMPEGCAHIIIYRNTSEEYNAFLTPEGYDAIKDYFSYRESKGEKLNDDSPLFVVEENKDPRHLSNDAVCSAMILIRTNAGTKRTRVSNHKYDKALTYGFRKRLNGALKIDGDVNPNIAEKLMGHSVTIPLDNVYLSNDDPRVVKACFAEYRKVLNEIVIHQESKLRVENMKLREESTLTTLEKALEVFGLDETDIDDLKDILSEKRKDRKFR